MKSQVLHGDLGSACSCSSRARADRGGFLFPIGQDNSAIFFGVRVLDSSPFCAFGITQIRFLNPLAVACDVKGHLDLPPLSTSLPCLGLSAPFCPEITQLFPYISLGHDLGDLQVSRNGTSYASFPVDLCLLDLYSCCDNGYRP